MGNAECCAGKREKFDRAKDYTVLAAGKCRAELAEKYKEAKSMTMEKYEELMMKQYRKRHMQMLVNRSQSIIFQAAADQTQGNTKFQIEIMKFESSFPLSRITMREFESKEIKGERVDDSVLISKFQSSKGFEDISNQESLTYKMLTYRSESPR
jgi:hypothetical protein